MTEQAKLDAKQAALRALAALAIRPGQAFKHYRTGHIYVIRDVGLFEGDLEPMVSYTRADDETVTIWFRLASVFMGHALLDGTLVPRFALLE